MGEGGFEGLSAFVEEVFFGLRDGGFVDVEDSGVADDGGEAEGDVGDTEFAGLGSGDGEELAAIEGDGFDDFFDGDTDGAAGSAFLGDDGGAGFFRFVEEFGSELVGESRDRGDVDTADGGATPDGDHGVSVLAKDEGFDVGGSDLEVVGEEGAEAGGVEDGAKTEDLGDGDEAGLDGEVGEDVDRVADDEDGGGRFELDVFEVFEDAFKESDVPVDEVEAGLIGFAAESGGDDDAV